MVSCLEGDSPVGSDRVMDDAAVCMLICFYDNMVGDMLGVRACADISVNI